MFELLRAKSRDIQSSSYPRPLSINSHNREYHKTCANNTQAGYEPSVHMEITRKFSLDPYDHQSHDNAHKHDNH